MATFFTTMKKQYRIKRHEEFSKIISSGKHKASAVFVMYYVPRAFDYDRVGISVGKKIGNAVQRNKVKRQVRMILMQNCNFDSGYDRIIIVRARYNHNDFEKNKKDLSTICNSVYNKQGQTF